MVILMVAAAAKPPDGGGQMHVAPSFAAVVGRSNDENGVTLGVVSTFRGEPSLRISRQEIESLAAPFHQALVGRFSAGQALHGGHTKILRDSGAQRALFSGPPGREARSD